MAYYTSYGGAGEVTGSCHLLKIGNIKILIDCGMFQGKEEGLNFQGFGFNPKDINYLILTHAHLDHIGRVPLLVKEGFSKEIITTRATFDIAKLMLKNSASILECEEEPLYTMKEVDPALELFGRFLEYDESLQLEENIKITFKNAGHILGAATVKVEFVEDEMLKSVVFSGDIGQRQRVITSSIDFWDNANYMFVESTYGGTIHKDLNISIIEFKNLILQTVNNGGTVIIPSFALERTQEVLYILRQMSEEAELSNIPVFLDSPLAIDVTKTFLQYPDLFCTEIKTLLKNGINPFAFKELTNCYNRDESIQINNIKGPKIIIAGSGMCEGGRVKYHLARYLSGENNMVLFVGYQVQSTLGRRIVEGNKDIKLLGSKLNIKAKIGQVEGFSAHADQKEIVEWIEKVEDLYCVYLIHGDEKKLQIMKEKIKTILKDKVHIVKMHERIYL